MSDDRLLRLRQAVLAGEPVPPALQSWLVRGIDGYLLGVNFTEALELRRTQSSRSPKQHVRDAVHGHMAIALAATPGTSVYARACKLERALKRFGSTTWPHWQKLSEAPSSATERERAMFMAYATAAAAGMEVPTSWRTIERRCVI